MSSEAPTQTFVEWRREDYRLHILPVVLGASLGFILFGITLHQFLHVFKIMHERATWYSRSWWVLMVLFWINLGDSVNKLVLFVRYMQSAALDGPLLFYKPADRTIIPVSIFQGTLTVYVQLLYTYRILRIVRGMAKFNPSHRRTKLITYGCLCVSGVLIIASGIGFIFYAIGVAKPIIDYFPGLFAPGIVGLGCASLVDVILCLCMVYHLQQHKTKSDFDKTNFMATKFIKLTLETGLAPTLIQVLELLFIVLKPRSGLWAGVGYFIGKLYVIAALVLYEASFATNMSSISHEREKNMHSSRELSRGQFRNQILVTQISVQQADAIEQSVQLENVHSPRSYREKKGEEALSSVQSYGV
ncbi:hypothetical protein BT69DRAFT_1346169 [Atractiella rhizophila]|nr:hypothetical protein BT69DRAFT_1346169 [Atractiella rhizophila]